MEKIASIIDLIDKAILEDPSNIITWWNIIADGYDDEVDSCRGLIISSKNWLSLYQSDLIKDTSISNLKIKYSWNSGYFIEVSKTSVSKVPEYFVHKQTLVNSARFITKDLLDFSWKLLEAEWKFFEREYKIFSQVRNTILDSFSDIKNLWEDVGLLDFGIANWKYIIKICALIY